MGGRGKNGKYPTIDTYVWSTFFFNGIEEKLYNVNGGLGKPGPARFSVDEWGTKNYYQESGSPLYTGSGKDLKLSINKQFHGIGPRINLIGQAMGQYYRIGEIRKTGKAQAWANRIYPAWALALDDGDEESDEGEG